HAHLRPAAAKAPSPPVPGWDPGFACLVDDRGKPVVYHVDRGGPAEKAGVKVGMTVTGVNGKPAEQAMTDFMSSQSRYWGYSSRRYLRYHAARFFARQMTQGAKVRVVLEGLDGKTQKLELASVLGVRYLPRLPVPIPGIRDSGEVSWKMLSGNIGYIYVRRIRNELIQRLDQAVGELKGAKGLIIDVRGNSGGGFDARRAHRNFALDDPAEPDRARFKGRIALLIDARCISAGEGWASWFIAKRRARVFGTATAGASGRKTTYTLRNDLYKVTFPVKAYRGFLDRPIERRGLEPDVVVRHSARHIAAGRDTVLHAARQYLLMPDAASDTRTTTRPATRPAGASAVRPGSLQAPEGASAQPAGKPADRAAVGAAAKRFLRALWDGNKAAIRGLVVGPPLGVTEEDLSKAKGRGPLGWTLERLPTLTNELRRPGTPWSQQALLSFREVVVKGRIAAIRIEGPKGYDKRYLLLILQRHPAGWRVLDLNTWSTDVSLTEAVRKVGRTAKYSPATARYLERGREITSLVASFYRYAKGKNGRWPDRLDGKSPDLGGAAAGYVYIKPSAEQLKAGLSGKVVVIYELPAKWPEGVWVGFLDGHATFWSHKRQLSQLPKPPRKPATPPAPLRASTQPGGERSGGAKPLGIDAAALVRKVRQDEEWIHEVKSFYVRLEGVWTRTPDGIAEGRADLKKR
ncbi:hypothetical protein LCGC14_2084670, partial [marine sediment metagenome]